MKAGTLRGRLTAALLTAMRNREADAIALTADRAKATAVALAGVTDDAEVDLAALDMPTRAAASVLGYHPEHVRRLIRSGRLRARRVGGDYRVTVDDLWPLIEARHGQPGMRRCAAAPMTIRALLSAADGSDREVDLRDEAIERIRDDELLWVDITGDDEEDLQDRWRRPPSERGRGGGSGRRSRGAERVGACWRRAAHVALAR